MKSLSFRSGLLLAEAARGKLGAPRFPGPKTTSKSLNRINTRARTSVKKKEVLEPVQIFAARYFHSVKGASAIAHFVLSSAMLPIALRAKHAWHARRVAASHLYGCVVVLPRSTVTDAGGSV
jgi:hypothetical protein